MFSQMIDQMEHKNKWYKFGSQTWCYKPLPNEHVPCYIVRPTGTGTGHQANVPPTDITSASRLQLSRLLQKQCAADKTQTCVIMKALKNIWFGNLFNIGEGGLPNPKT